MLLNKLRTATMMLVALAMVAFGGSLAVTHATAEAQPDQAEQVDAKSPIRGGLATPAPAPHGKIEEPQFMFDTKVVEVERDGRLRIMAQPRIITLEDQVAKFQIEDPSDFPNIADGCYMRNGTRFAIKAKRVDAGKAQIDLTVSTCKVEKAEKVDTLIVSNGVRAVKEVAIGKRCRFVLSQDRQGKPQLWVELTVREADFEPGPVPPLHGVAVPAAKEPQRADPMPIIDGPIPEKAGAPWPFIK